MQQLARLRQERDKFIEDYMIRVRRLVLQAKQNLQPKEQEELFISHFITGLANDKLAQHIMTVSPPTSAEANRIATCSKVLQEFQRAKQAAKALYAGRAEATACEFDEEQLDVADANVMADDEKTAELLGPRVTARFGQLAIALTPSGLRE